MTMHYICPNCGRIIKDGEPFDFVNGTAYHTYVRECLNALRERIETLEQRQGYVRPALGGRVLEIKQGGPGETGPERDQ